MPNITSILNNSSATRTVLSLCKGILYVYSLYTKKATVAERKYYNKHFLWQFIIIAMRCLRVVDSVVDIKKIRDEFVFLYNKGVFDNPPTLRARRYRRRIMSFIEKR